MHACPHRHGCVGQSEPCVEPDESSVNDARRLDHWPYHGAGWRDRSHISVKATRSVIHHSRPVRSKPRVLFYSHDGLGLGHLRITLAVAEALNRSVPSAARLLVTGSPSVGAFNLPETLDYVRMPGPGKWSLFENDVDEDPGAPRDVFPLREAIIAATVDGFTPHLVVVDHNPAGLAGELLPVLNRVRASKRRPRFVLGLRDITYGPEMTRLEWEMSGAYALLEEVYDLILIYGCRHVFDPIGEYGLSAAIAAKTIFTGYLRRPERRRPAREIRQELGATEAPLVVVSVGGGADGAPVIEAFLEAVRRKLLDGVVASVVAGPQMPEADQARLSDLARALPGVTLVPFRNDLESQIAAADAVITMGGYNGVWEAVGAGKRPIVVPRVAARMAGSDEQELRAERLAALGLGTVVQPDVLTPERLADAVTAELGRGITPAITLDFDGLDRAGEALAGVLRV